MMVVMVVWLRTRGLGHRRRGGESRSGRDEDNLGRRRRSLALLYQRQDQA